MMVNMKVNQIVKVININLIISNTSVTSINNVKLPFPLQYYFTINHSPCATLYLYSKHAAAYVHAGMRLIP